MCQGVRRNGLGWLDSIRHGWAKGIDSLVAPKMLYANGASIRAFELTLKHDSPKLLQRKDRGWVSKELK
jgi:hypothetical protein